MHAQQSNNSVFLGASGLRTFLNPNKNFYTPLVELPPEINPFGKYRIRIAAKLMNALPLGNVKSVPAFNMLAEHPDTVSTIIENSSGNTVFSLAVLGKLFGITQTKAIVSHEVSLGKLQLLRLLGTEVIVNQEPLCPDPNDLESGIHKAKQWAKQYGWFNPGQYDNLANPQAHEKLTGPDIWKQTDGKLSLFCAGLGTTGTAVGVSAFFKKQITKVSTIGVVRKANNPVPGVRTPRLLDQIAFPWQKYVDTTVEISTQESYQYSMQLCRSGLLVGPSSGFALAGLLDFLSNAIEKDTLDSYRNSDGEILAVFICPDSPLPYLNEYFTYLDETYFPPIEHEELLTHNQHSEKNQKKLRQSTVAEISAPDLFAMIYQHTIEEAWNKINTGQPVVIKNGFRVIDLRNNHSFLDFHLPGSENLSLEEVAENITQGKYSNKEMVIFVCSWGEMSSIATEKALSNGLQAINLHGGLTQWSSYNLPRIKSEKCLLI